MCRLFLFFLSLVVSFNIFAGEEINLNSNTKVRNIFLSIPSVQEEISLLKTIESEGLTLNFLYFISFENRMPIGIPPGYYAANEHVMMYKSSNNKLICEIRTNIVWQRINGEFVWYEDYSEPARPYRCYNKNTFYTQ